MTFKCVVCKRSDFKSELGLFQHQQFSTKCKIAIQTMQPIQPRVRERVEQTHHVMSPVSGDSVSTPEDNHIHCNEEDSEDGGYYLPDSSDSDNKKRSNKEPIQLPKLAWFFPPPISQASTTRIAPNKSTICLNTLNS